MKGKMEIQIAKPKAFICKNAGCMPACGVGKKFPCPHSVNHNERFIIEGENVGKSACGLGCGKGKDLVPCEEVIIL